MAGGGNRGPANRAPGALKRVDDPQIDRLPHGDIAVFGRQDDTIGARAVIEDAHPVIAIVEDTVDAGPTEFTGFDELTTEARILGIFVDGKRVPVVSDSQLDPRITYSSGD